jgi:pyruvate/2-oxoglutarate dehydrogenase complex dihydrolipoamide acyltransferase (E2) component
MKEHEPYTIKEIPSSRQSTFDIGYLGVRNHHMKALLELDVTHGRELIRHYRSSNKEPISFTGWIMKCISQAVAEHKSVHGIRKGKNELVIFDDVDISIIIEKEINGEKVPLPLVIRKVNEKTLQDIQDEILTAKEQTIETTEDYVLGNHPYKWVMRFYLTLPQFLRIMIWKHILKNPFLMKNTAGTIVVTSVTAIGNAKGWVIPVSIHPICFALGSLVKKPGVFEGKIAIREYLYMTVLLNHDVIDGAPAARFISRLSGLIESGYGI